jgi:type VI secretion system secreted protein VgrG
VPAQVINVRSGYKFDVDEHPRGDFNREYLCVRVEHFANQSGDPHWRKVLDIPFDDEYRVEVEAIAADRQFRAERRMPWPRIYGVESGVIDGPAASDYAQIDEHGRYHVKINFDEGPGAGDTSSTWIRMAQPHGGGTEGFHFPLRKDTEVMLSFLGGDPDRPIISAVLPNATKPSPVTSSNNTQNVIQTGGRNLIEIEDQDGVQYIDVSTPTQDTFLRMGEPRADHHIDLSTQGDGHVYTGGDLDVEVMGDKTEHVVGDVTEDYDSNQDSTIGIDKTTTVVANHTMDVGGNQDITVTGDQTVTVLGTQTVNVTADQTEVFTANKTVAITADATASIGGNSASCTIGTAASVTIGAFSSVKLANEMSFTGGNYVGVTVGNFINTTIGNSASVKVAMDDSVTIGVTNAAYIGIKNSLFVGGKADLTVAAIIDISLAAKLSISAALKAEFTAAVGIDYKATKVKDNAVVTETAKVLQLEATVNMLTAKTNVLSNQILLLAN